MNWYNMNWCKSKIINFELYFDNDIFNLYFRFVILSLAKNLTQILASCRTSYAQTDKIQNN